LIATWLAFPLDPACHLCYVEDVINNPTESTARNCANLRAADGGNRLVNRQRYAAQAQAPLKELAPYLSDQDSEKLKQLDAEASVAVNSLMVQDIGIGLRYLAERVR
jgi:hypothetical protein